MKHRVLIFALAAAALLGTGPAAADNLLDVYRKAETNDPTWQGAVAGHRASVERAPQGRALLLPSLIFTANSYVVDQQTTISGTTTNSSYDSNGYVLQFTQPLYRKTSFSTYTQGRLAVTQADAELAIARQDLMLRTAQAYFDVLAAQDNLEFATTEKTAIAGQRDLAERNFSVGNATVVDVHEARARYDLAVAQEVAADNALRVKQEALITLTAAPPGGLAKLIPKLKLELPEPADMDHWVQAANQQNLQLQVQEQTYAIAREETEKSRGGHYPTLDLVASHNYNKAGGSLYFAGDLEYTTNQVGLQLQVPIFQGGATQSKVRESLAREDQARDGLEQTRRQTVRLTREAYLAVTSGAAQVQALEQALVSSQKALESTQLGYETGVRTAVDVLNAQRDLFRTRRDLSQARYNYLLAKLRLKSAVGTLNEQDMAAINGLLTGG